MSKFTWVLLPIIILTLLVGGFVVKAVGYYGNTIVERNVFENSYQRSESLKARIAIDEAALAEITHLLTNPNLTTNARRNLEAQASAVRIRIATTKRKQQ